jgi:hypothetical protein
MSSVQPIAMEELRYPIGRYHFEPGVTDAQRQQWINEIAAVPAELRSAVAGLSPAQLDTPYRPGGWTVRQVAHHVPDSHLNAYTRTKLALTEDAPIVRPFDEVRWAELPDGRTAPVELSLALLTALHDRWVLALRALQPADCARTFVHPAHGHAKTLDALMGQYAWHGRHHVAHITSLRVRMQWQ